MKTKNLFLSMLAMASMLFATSCSQEELVNEPIADEYVSATFTIGTADGIGSRTIGDGTNADVVACAVFDAAGNEMTELRNNTLPVTNKTATYSIRVAKGQAYRVAFFAYNSAAAAYDLTNFKSIKIKPNQASNIENRDAFTNYIDITAQETAAGEISKPVTLKRPFAQLNLGIDAAELEAARKAGIVVTNSQITVTNVYNAFNAFDNDVADDAVAAPMTFALNAIPTEDLIVENQSYEYLALNYLLVGDKGQEKSLTDVEFVWETADGKTNNPTTHFVNIPVQRNYRTNILGRLLTNPATFNITIDADFETPDYNIGFETAVTTEVGTVDELIAAVNTAPEGQTIIKVTSDLTSTAKVELDQQRNAQIFIDGQNHTFDLWMVIDGNNMWTGTEEMTIQNINFNYTGSQAEIIAIATDAASTGNSYAHNIHIKNCTFNGPAAATAIRAKQAFDLDIYKCTAQNLHSFSQITSTVGTTIDQVTSNCLRGMHVDARNCVVSNSNITATGGDKYGIRHEIGNVNDGLKILNCTVAASFPVVVRNNDNVAVASYTLTFEGTNTLTPAASAYHVAIAQQEYDNIGESLTTLTGTVTVTGADAAWSIFK